MISSFKLVRSHSLDPFKNLCLENQLLASVGENQKIILFYSNSPALVMGRFQNPWLECDVSEVVNNRVQMVRRQSGGGCVYHDEGNLNFCFIHGTREFFKHENNQIIIDALKNFGIDAYSSGRSDLLIGKDHPLKFSGSAFKQKKDRSFHHGTLLIESDLTKLNALLKSKMNTILESKSIASNPATVINLSELNRDLAVDTLIDQIKAVAELHYNVKAQLSEVHDVELDEYHQHLTSWDWVWGETPKFKLKLGESILVIHKGIILAESVNVDNLLIGKKLKMSELNPVLPKLNAKNSNQIIEFLKKMTIA